MPPVGFEPTISAGERPVVAALLVVARPDVGHGGARNMFGKTKRQVINLKTVASDWSIYLNSRINVLSFFSDGLFVLPLIQ